MASIPHVNIHGADVVKAEAEKVKDGSWLRLSIGKTWPATVVLFMDFDLAQIYAAAINGANNQHQALLDDEAEFEASKRVQSYADEHRLRKEELV